jgi:hypothetical protein
MTHSASARRGALMRGEDGGADAIIGQNRRVNDPRLLAVAPESPVAKRS